VHVHIPEPRGMHFAPADSELMRDIGERAYLERYPANAAGAFVQLSDKAGQLGAGVSAARPPSAVNAGALTRFACGSSRGRALLAGRVECSPASGSSGQRRA
jgi:hypothetical protein